MDWFKAILQGVGLLTNTISNLVSGERSEPSVSRAERSRRERAEAERQWARELEEKWGMTVPMENPKDKN
jgi:hypothetical protein